MNGQLQSSCLYVNGRLEGEYKWFYVTGQLGEIHNFKNGLENGISRVWDIDGNLTTKHVINDIEFDSEEDALGAQLSFAW